MINRRGDTQDKVLGDFHNFDVLAGNVELDGEQELFQDGANSALSGVLIGCLKLKSSNQKTSFVL